MGSIDCFFLGGGAFHLKTMHLHRILWHIFKATQTSKLSVQSDKGFGNQHGLDEEEAVGLVFRGERLQLPDLELCYLKKKTAFYDKADLKDISP